MTDVDYVTYSRDLRGGHASIGPGGQVSAAFGADGQSSLSLSTNLDEGQEIGLYRGKLPVATVARLVELLRQSSYQNLPPGQPLRPDMPTMSVGMAMKGTPAPVIRGFTFDGIPAPVAEYEKAARDAVKALLEHRDRVIRGAARAQRERFAPGAPLAFEVTLENIGKSALGTSRPTARNVKVRLERDPDPPATVNWEKDVWEIEPRVSAGQQGRAKVAPGEALRFTAEVTPPAAAGAGPYRAVITYFASANPSGDPAAIEGALSVRTPRFEIGKP